MAAKYLLPCSCGEQIAVEASQAGQETRCRCGAVLEIPTMRGLAQLDRSRPDPSVAGPISPATTGRASRRPRAADKPTARRSISSWGPRQRLVLVGTVVTILGLALASFYYLTRPRLIDAESLSPLATWQIWHDLRQGIDLRPPWEELYLRSLASYRRWMVFALAIAAIGLLVMASALLVPTRRSRRRRRGPMPKARGPG